MDYCTQCSTALEAGANWCSNCDAPAGWDESQYSPVVADDPSNVASAFVILGVIGLAVGAWFVTRADVDDRPIAEAAASATTVSVAETSGPPETVAIPTTTDNPTVLPVNVLTVDVREAVTGFEGALDLFEAETGILVEVQSTNGSPDLRDELIDAGEPPDIAIVQVVKQRKADGLAITRRIFQGGQEMVARLLLQTQQGGVINTAYIERLNATFRQRLAHLARRTRCPARESATLSAGMYIVGCFYNFCSPHKSLRVKIWISERTPAIAAGITDHIWTPTELLWFRLPPEPWSPPKQRGRRSKETLKLIEKWCS